MPILTESNLAGVDLLILSPGNTTTSDGTPLSSDEQSALLSFVSQGGGVMLLTDNYSYAPNAAAEEMAMLSVFGSKGFGTTTGLTVAQVISPPSQPVTSGSFGTVTTFTQYFAGAITNLGPYATAVATNVLGVALAVIPHGALNPGSGAVAIFSDGNTFGDDNGDGAQGYFSSNEALFLNTVTWTRRTNWIPKLYIQSALGKVVVSWPAAASGFSLDSSAALGAGALWQPVGSITNVLGTLNVVTNDITSVPQFYRLRK
jgi:hypothetical protein